MFKTITRLFFGGEEETPDDVKSGEVVEEGWLVVSHQETGSVENQGAELTDTQPPNSALHGDTVANMETDMSSTLLSFRIGTPVCFSKLDVCRQPFTCVRPRTHSSKQQHHRSSHHRLCFSA
ncbi:tumor protein p53-inducible nuclear protein 2 isoform X2 [Sander vitreus]